MAFLKGLLNSIQSFSAQKSEEINVISEQEQPKASPTPYIYRPNTVSISFASAIEQLRASGRSVVDRPIDNIHPSIVANIIELGKEIGIEFIETVIDTNLYQQYLNQAAYKQRYSEYYRGNQPEKTLEHYISYSLLNLTPSDIFVDLASEHSPVPEIFGRLSGAQTYSQDIMYPDGIQGNRIGGDACSMPVPDNFMTKATLTCSLEHFEGDADTRLFQELARVLKPGGTVCVVPFYVFNQEATQTDPTVSVPANVPFDKTATIYCAKGWGNRHGRFYSPQSFVERIIRPVQDQFKFQFFYLKNAGEIDNSIYVRFAFTATRL